METARLKFKQLIRNTTRRCCCQLFNHFGFVFFFFPCSVVRVFTIPPLLRFAQCAFTIKLYNNAIPLNIEDVKCNFSHSGTRTCRYCPVTCAVRGSVSPVFFSRFFICSIVFWFLLFFFSVLKRSSL